MAKGKQKKVIVSTLKEHLTTKQQEINQEEKVRMVFKDYILSIIQGESGRKPNANVKSAQAAEDRAIPNSMFNLIIKKVKFSSRPVSVDLSHLIEGRDLLLHFGLGI